MDSLRWKILIVQQKNQSKPKILMLMQKLNCLEEKGMLWLVTSGV